MTIVVLGIDLGKNSCSLAGLDASGRIVLRRRLRRSSVEGFVTSLERCTVAMEACCGAHHLGRVFAARGHTVRLMSPEYVRPYVKAQKNDDLDAEAIAEAATRPTMRFVELKSQAQSDVQALHRARERLVAERTALINHLRALLLERGIVVPQGRRKLEEELAVFADEEESEALSPRIRRLIEDLRSEWRALDERIAAFDAEFVSMARNNEAARRLMTIPGIGTINATALAAAVGDARTFRRGRDMAAWLGLVPRQMTTGGKPRLLGISKRGNRYLRKNLIHGARAVLPYLVTRDTPLARWARGLLARTHKNVVVVALANKLARIAWAILAHGRIYDPGVEAAA
ncbi:MAG TPA: IS110 family transposase [Pseudolabrys sp.]|nr:IS110 family transposase [Pseudolabrys sp.]